MTGSESGPRLVAILAADAAGYSRLMAIDERSTVAALDCARTLFRDQVQAHQGRVVDMAGDSVLAVFGTANGAVSAALAIQRDLDASRGSVPEARQMRYRIGVHLGDVIEKGDGTVYGDGVNIAARLQALADIGGILVSDAVHGVVRGKVTASFVDRGEQSMKNMRHPVRAFAVSEGGGAASPASAPIGFGPPLIAGAVGVDQPCRTAADNEVAAEAKRPWIAALPFTNMSGDPAQDYFADGTVEDVITALARTGFFNVIARNSSFVYKGRAVDVRQVGRELGVGYVLEGSVRKAANRVRITAQLIDATTGAHVWADRFDGALEGIFELQDRITESVVGALVPNVARAEYERALVKPTANLQAYDLVMRASPGFNPAAPRAQRDEAATLLARALELDPRYSLAKAMSATLCAQRLQEGDGDAQTVKNGLRLADEALADHRENPLTLCFAGATLAMLGYRVLGMRVIGFRYDEALLAVDRAVSLTQDVSIVMTCAGVVRMCIGDGETAIRHVERAIRLNPLENTRGFYQGIISAAHLVCGRHLQALESADAALRENPHYSSAHRLRTVALGFLGRGEEAREAARRLMELAPTLTVSRYLSAAPIKDAQYRKRAAEMLRAAGVPR